MTFGPKFIVRGDFSGHSEGNLSSNSLNWLIVKVPPRVCVFNFAKMFSKIIFLVRHNLST